MASSSSAETGTVPEHAARGPAPGVEFRLLGPFSVHCAGMPLAKLPTGPAQHLLICLLLHPDRRHRRDWLMDQVWPGGQVTRSAFNTALWRVRRFVGALAGVEVELLGDAVRLTLDRRQAIVDADELLREAGAVLAGAPGEAGLAALSAAVRRWRGPCADGLMQDWALVARERLSAAYLQGLSALMRDAARGERYELALDYGRRILGEDPFRESVHCEMMWLLVLTGQRARAIRSHAAFRALLEAELGIAPMTETEALFAYIRDGLEAPVAVPDTAPANPGAQARRYRGYLDAVDRSRAQVFAALQPHTSNH